MNPTVKPVILSFVTVLALCFSTSSAGEKIYTWKDENGRVHFSNEPRPDKKESDVIDVKPPERQNNSAADQKRKREYDRWLKEQTSQDYNDALKSKEARDKSISKAKATRKKNCDKYKTKLLDIKNYYDVRKRAGVRAKTKAYYEGQINMYEEKIKREC